MYCFDLPQIFSFGNNIFVTERVDRFDSGFFTIFVNICIWLRQGRAQKGGLGQARSQGGQLPLQFQKLQQKFLGQSSLWCVSQRNIPMQTIKNACGTYCII